MVKISECRLGFIGFGHLAQVIFQQLEGARLIPRSQILFIQRDSHKMRESEKKFGITSTSLETLVKQSDLLFLAVRPNQLETVLKELATLGAHDKKITTVVAGIPFSFYKRFLGSSAQILRSMPNLASGVGEGMTALCYSPECSIEFRSLGNLLFKSLGRTVELEEALMDISVGISGSGPGFVFRLIEAMARAGEKGGIAYEKALVMAAQTFLGAAKLILQGQSPQSLCEQIAVPGGTTEAGFAVMKQTEMEKHFQQIVDAATKKSREISEEFK